MTDQEILRHYEKKEYDLPMYYIYKQSGWFDMVRRVVNNPHSTISAKDVFQDAAKRLHLRLKGGHYRGNGPLRGYFYKIVMHVWLEYLRYERNHRKHVANSKRPLETYLREQLERGWMKDNVEELLQRMMPLTEDERKILLLVAEDYSMREIAAILQINERYARQKHYRAKKKFRALPGISNYNDLTN